MNDEYLIYGETLTNIANSIRSVSNVSTTWTPDEMAAYILANLVKPTTRQAAKTYTPGTSNQTIPAGTFLTGAATITGDSDLAVGNIKKGVNIFGKTGTLDGAWGNSSNFAGITKVKSGSVTIAKAYPYTVIEHTITHGLGSVPKIFILFLGDQEMDISSYYGNIIHVITVQFYCQYSNSAKLLLEMSPTVLASYGNIVVYDLDNPNPLNDGISAGTFYTTFDTNNAYIKGYRQSGSPNLLRALAVGVPYYWLAMA